MYEYRARCVEVVDGDTLDVVVDLGFHIERQIRLRLQGVDTHETYGVSHDSEEYRRGVREAEYVEAWIAEGNGDWPIIVRTEKTGKYGRYLAEVERQSDGAVLNESLREMFDDVDAREESDA